jgi:hypothetical protein
MEMLIRDSGLTIKLMDKVNIYILMELNMLEIGLKINNMGKEWKLGLMELDLKDNI